jgi:hypothetical protein
MSMKTSANHRKDMKNLNSLMTVGCKHRTRTPKNLRLQVPMYAELARRAGKTEKSEKLSTPLRLLCRFRPA